MTAIVSSSVFSMPRNSDKENQDSVLLPTQVEDGFLMAIADGVGGYKGGKEASSTVISCLSKQKLKIQSSEIETLFKHFKKTVSELSIDDESLDSAATTLTFCQIDNTELIVGHSGDCRVYIKNGQKLEQITKDHTQHQLLIDNGIYTAKELKHAKGKNIITTAISKTVDLDFQKIVIKISDLPIDNGIFSLYIMSDGAHSFWEQRPRFSANTLANSANFASSLRRRIESKGPVDDYSLIAVNIKCPFPPQST